MTAWNFTAEERSLYRRLTTPEKIQRFLDEDVRYNKEHTGPSSKGPRFVVHQRLGHCMEGALFGAAALRLLGNQPLVVDLLSIRDDDHVIAVFRQYGCWGAVAKSNYSGLRFREPVYKTIRELAMSYFEHYFNHQREKTLRGYSRPVNLKRFDHLDWMTAEHDVWEIPYHLLEVPHTRILSRETERRLTRMDRRLYEAGQLGAIL